MNLCKGNRGSVSVAVLLAIGVGSLGLPSAGFAQRGQISKEQRPQRIVSLSRITSGFGIHGVQIGKSCVSPTCVGDNTDCIILIAHADTYGDTIQVNEAYDVIKPNVMGQSVRVPAVGNLPIVSVEGNAFCTDSGGVCDPSTGANCALPCRIGAANSTLSGLPGEPFPGIVRFRQDQYIIQPGDPSPLADQANLNVRDLCDSPNTQGCSMLNSLVQFTASTAVPNCDDGNSCTTDVCAGGVCDNIPDCLTAADCNDNDDCTQDVCTAQGCCVNTPLCPSLIGCDDQNVCTTDVCLASGCCENTPECLSAADCDDDDDCTNDLCTAQGCCLNIPLCIDDPDCDTDRLLCTVDTCGADGCCDQSPLCPAGVLCCADGASCDDGDPCTTDTCVAGCCVNIPLCDDQADCEDGLMCTVDICGADGCCDSSPLCVGAVCCADGAACDDGDACTTDECIAGCCRSTPLCDAQADCEDGLICTVDICGADGCCDSSPLCVGAVCCADGALCDDNDVCTTDICTPAGCCENIPLCLADADCADGNSCTRDVCVDGCCKYVPDCKDPTNCDDDNSCTTDTCVDSCCVHTPDCLTAADCNDGVMCTVDSCSAEGCCGVVPLCPAGVLCCADGASCDDGDDCTTDECIEGCCRSTPLCDDQADCEDGLMCTVDLCGADGCCDSSPLCVGAVCCADGAACDDGDSCTTDECIAGCCRSTPLCDEQTDCEDGLMCTVNVCGANGCCGSSPLCVDAVCCADGAPCDDGDACTDDACVGGNCCGHTPHVCEERDCFSVICDSAQGCVYTNICICGDGDLDPGEQCDGDVFEPGAPATHGSCRADCTYCGDGDMNGDESCDDGNTNDDDGCRNDCTRCGDGEMNGDESCDDGNTDNDDGCRNDCTRCGDGETNGDESCDDGNTNNDDGCRNDCTRCGDGETNGGEMCDDGNTDNNDGCSNNCTSGCGNGILNTGEQCDGEAFEPGAPATHGPCRSDCTFCGDGTMNGSETCDDGDADNGDECRNNCTRCGDGNMDEGEECDGDAESPCAGTCTESCTCPVMGGCRITGGRTGGNGGRDDGMFEDIIRGQGGGQVGAPCGCIGCFTTPDPEDDLAFEHVQGQWQYDRKDKKGNFHAKEFNSLICGCSPTSPTCDGAGVISAGFNNPQNFQHGQLCNPGDRIVGPEPRHAPANIACFSGIGAWTSSNGRKDQEVAFRVEVEDRGEPSQGGNADDTCDVHRIRIWIPGPGEDVKLLADGACCTNAVPAGQAARDPNIDDGGILTHGNMQIHPMTPNSAQGRCPVPDGACQR